MRHSPLAYLLLLSFSSVVFGQQHPTETLGPTYEIIEQDMLEAIETKLRDMENSGELDRLKDAAIERTKRSVDRPRPVSTLTVARKSRTFYYDPTFTLDKTVKDHAGSVVAESGKQINPLLYVNLSKYLLFFDGDDPKQVAIAQELFAHYQGNVKPILTNGSIGEITRSWKQRIYFDQGGVLVRKLGITKVPSLVTQEGSKLRIDELAVPQ